MVAVTSKHEAIDRVVGPEGAQRFGRIESVRPADSQTELGIRQPDGGLLVAILAQESGTLESGSALAGRNIWVSGQSEGEEFGVSAYQIFADW